MPARQPVLTGLVAVGVSSVVALAGVFLVLPPLTQAAPDLRALQEVVSAAQFELAAGNGLPWYFCH
jgi:hypothetical protein